MCPPEVWLEGPIPGIPFLLQPAAHALLQTERELCNCLEEFPDSLLWETVAGMASVGFHLQHLSGVLDRLNTYALELSLSDDQINYLENEKTANPSLTTKELLQRFSKKVANTLDQFGKTNEEQLREFRTVGRKNLPSTVLGLYFHMAEHSQRHLGQILVTVSVLKERHKKEG